MYLSWALTATLIMLQRMIGISVSSSLFQCIFYILMYMGMIMQTTKFLNDTYYWMRTHTRKHAEKHLVRIQPLLHNMAEHRFEYSSLSSSLLITPQYQHTVWVCVAKVSWPLFYHQQNDNNLPEILGWSTHTLAYHQSWCKSQELQELVYLLHPHWGNLQVLDWDSTAVPYIRKHPYWVHVWYGRCHELISKAL